MTLCHSSRLLEGLAVVQKVCNFEWQPFSCKKKKRLVIFSEARSRQTPPVYVSSFFHRNLQQDYWRLGYWCYRPPSVDQNSSAMSCPSKAPFLLSSKFRVLESRVRSWCELKDVLKVLWQNYGKTSTKKCTKRKLTGATYETDTGDQLLTSVTWPDSEPWARYRQFSTIARFRQKYFRKQTPFRISSGCFKQRQRGSQLL